MVMLGSADNASQWGRQVAQPDEIGMRETQSPCVIVADTDAHYARAKDAGATIVMDIADQDYGGRGHSRRDLQGPPWWFGSSDPLEAHTRPSLFPHPAAHGPTQPPRRPLRPDGPVPAPHPPPHPAGPSAPARAPHP